MNSVKWKGEIGQTYEYPRKRKTANQKKAGQKMTQMEEGKTPPRYHPSPLSCRA
jgi:hypothetical protein